MHRRDSSKRNLKDVPAPEVTRAKQVTGDKKQKTRTQKEVKEMTMRTALVRGTNGLSIKRYDDYKSNAEFAEDLRANGYKVLKVWKGFKSDAEVDEWEFINRR